MEHFLTTIKLIQFSSESMYAAFVNSTFFVCTHQSAARPRLSVENPRPERVVFREAGSNLKAGGPPFISAVFERVAKGGEGGVISVETPLLGEASIKSMPTRIPKYGSVSYLGTQDSPEQW